MMPTLEAAGTIIMWIILPIVLIVSLTFLPSIIELKRPRDAGPKLIHPCFKSGFAGLKSSLVVDAEADLVSVHSVEKISLIFPAFISNIEA